MGFNVRLSSALEVPAEGVVTWHDLFDMIDDVRGDLKAAWIDPDVLRQEVETARLNHQRLSPSQSPYMAATPAIIRRIQHLLLFHTSDLEPEEEINAPHLRIAPGTNAPVDPVQAQPPHIHPVTADISVA